MNNKPHFYRQNYGALPRIKSSWRKPKGIHSKLRHGFAGHRTKVEPGYGTPAELKGLGKDQLIPVLVNTTGELQGLDAKKYGIIIAHIGMKQKISITKTAQEKKLTIFNLKNPTQFLTNAEAEIKTRKEAKKTTVNKVQQKTANVQPEKETTETKEHEKKELDKLLTKKEQ